MKNITRHFEVFTWDELSEDAKDKAINDYIGFLLEVTEYEHASDSVKRAFDDAERMQTPWFVGQYIWDYCKDEILENLKECQYLHNGELFA